MKNTLKLIICLLIVAIGNVFIDQSNIYINLIGYAINGGLVGYLVGSQ